ncbi:MAG: type II toxin-antitoxin system VapC family toxin [Planctomycetes bacterium]|nr:type II toxin-antitoxin system VapC family toxin [Planctomycetota bacterium]
MTTVLLDTHTVLWFWWDDPQLSPGAKAVICDPQVRKLVSLVTPWEVAIKVSRNKLDIGSPYARFFPQHMVRTFFEWLIPTEAHFCRLVALPFHHRDPFDRLLVAQALAENIPLVSGDAAFDPYGVPRIW